MKKANLKNFGFMILGSILTLAIVFAIPTVSALVATRTATVTNKDIKVFIDGEAVTLTDLDGNTVEPILVFDTLYAPVSPLARAFGKTSTYSGKDNAVYIADRVIEKSYMFDVLQAYEHSGRTYYEENVSFAMLGESYTKGCIFKPYYDGSISASYYLKGQYKTIKGIIGYVDGCEKRNSKFSIILDGKPYKEYEFTANTMPREIIIDVTGAEIVTFSFEINKDTRGYPKCGFGNVTIE